MSLTSEVDGAGFGVVDRHVAERHRDWISRRLGFNHHVQRDREHGGVWAQVGQGRVGRDDGERDFLPAPGHARAGRGRTAPPPRDHHHLLLGKVDLRQDCRATGGVEEDRRSRQVVGRSDHDLLLRRFAGSGDGHLQVLRVDLPHGRPVDGEHRTRDDHRHRTQYASHDAPALLGRLRANHPALPTRGAIRRVVVAAVRYESVTPRSRWPSGPRGRVTVGERGGEIGSPVPRVAGGGAAAGYPGGPTSSSPPGSGCGSGRRRGRASSPAG